MMNMTIKSRFWHEGIKTIKDLLEDRNLRRQVVQYFDFDFEGIDNIKPNKIYKTGINEKRDDLIILLGNLGFVEIDWNGLQEQTHKLIGQRTLEFQFEGSKILKLLKQIEQKEKEDAGEEIPNAKLEFNDNEATLKYGNKTCKLPPFKNEHFFCRAIFEYPKNEPVDWSLIYEEMTGYQFIKKDVTEKDSRMVYDTLEALNKRTEELLGIKNLFIWRKKTIKRTK